jgi:hypothetical protein
VPAIMFGMTSRQYMTASAAEIMLHGDLQVRDAHSERICLLPERFHAVPAMMFGMTSDEYTTASAAAPRFFAAIPKFAMRTVSASAFCLYASSAWRIQRAV